MRRGRVRPHPPPGGDPGSGVECVEVLVPPRFEAGGEVKPIEAAVRDGDWIGVFVLWVVRPGPALIYQERGPLGWAAGKLDVSAAGYYRPGESGLDGLREAVEELGRSYRRDEVVPVGRCLNVAVDGAGRERRSVLSIFMTLDPEPVTRFSPDPDEVPAIYELPVVEVERLFLDPSASCLAHGIDCHGRAVARTVAAHDFSYMWNDFHLEMARAARLYARRRR